MKKPELKFIRKRNLILKADGSLFEKHKSISQAKRFSRIQQNAAGGCGCGLVQVDRTDDPKPPKLNFTKSKIATGKQFFRNRTSKPIVWDKSSLDTRLLVKAGL
jgi:hypothetical protein